MQARLNQYFFSGEYTFKRKNFCAALQHRINPCRLQVQAAGVQNKFSSPEMMTQNFASPLSPLTMFL